MVLLLAPVYCGVLWCLLSLIAGFLTFDSPFDTAVDMVTGPGSLLEDTIRFIGADEPRSHWWAEAAGLLGMWAAVWAIPVSQLLLFVPIARRSPRGSPRPMRWAIAGVGLACGAMLIGGLVVVAEMSVALASGSATMGTPSILPAAGILLIISWCIWIPLLLHRSKGREADALERYTALAMRGTWVELALATPVYALIRSRDSCWCAISSYWAMLAGFCALAALGGPFLVLSRRRRRWLAGSTCVNCGYEKGPAPGTICPECGHDWRQSVN